MKRPLSLLFGLAALVVAAAPAPADAFCGFFVSKADTKLFNKASKVVIARDGDRTVMTMSNDFKGEPKEFAVVVPVPTFLQKSQIHVGEQAPSTTHAFPHRAWSSYFDEKRRSAGYLACRPVRRGGPIAAADDACRPSARRDHRATTRRRVRHPILSAKESGGRPTCDAASTSAARGGPVLASTGAEHAIFVAKGNPSRRRLGFNTAALRC